MGMVDTHEIVVWQEVFQLTKVAADNDRLAVQLADRGIVPISLAGYTGYVGHDQSIQRGQGQTLFNCAFLTEILEQGEELLRCLPRLGSIHGLVDRGCQFDRVHRFQKEVQSAEAYGLHGITFMGRGEDDMRAFLTERFQQFESRGCPELAIRN